MPTPTTHPASQKAELLARTIYADVAMHIPDDSWDTKRVRNLYQDVRDSLAAFVYEQRHLFATELLQTLLKKMEVYQHKPGLISFTPSEARLIQAVGQHVYSGSSSVGAHTAYQRLTEANLHTFIKVARLARKRYEQEGFVPDAFIELKDLQLALLIKLAIKYGARLKKQADARV